MSPTRMMTYPSTITPLSTCSPCSIDSNIGGNPSASTSTPIIWTIVRRR